MEANNDCILFDGDIITSGQPVVPIFSRGLMYGEGVFDTFRTYSGQTLLLSDHISRLHEGLDVLGITVPEKLTANTIASQLKQLLLKNNLTEQDAIVRLQVWRDGSRGYKPEKNARVHYSITASQCPDKFSSPHLVSVDRKRVPSESLPSNYKFTNGINYILAAREAAQKGGDDALMETMSSWVSETTKANIFWLKDTTVFTPSVECDLLPGITRDILMRLIEQHDTWKLKTGTFELTHILDSDVVWISNSVRELLAVKAIDDRIYETDSEIFLELKQRFCEYRDQQLKSL